MGKWQGRSKRKPTGGLYHRHKKKRKHEYGSNPTRTGIGEESKIEEKGRGNSTKIRLKEGNRVNVAMPSEGKTETVEIEEVIKNPASPDLTRRNIITKGAILKTELGEVKITSRPGQDGLLNGILVESK